MKTLFKSAAILSLLFLGTLAFAEGDTATSTPSNDASVMSRISFPIADLGGCDSREACRLYCDVASHRDACFAYAQKVGLMSKEKINAAKIIISKKGPGSCGSKESCVAYCADSAHADECLSFAQNHKILGDDKISLIKKLVRGEGPGACKSQESCRGYCADSAHADECRAFAQDNGLRPKMGSTTNMMPKPPRMGSSTSAEVHRVLASTTPGKERGMELRDIRDTRGSTTPNNPFRKPLLPPKPQNAPRDSGEKDNLGASVIKAFVHLLGF